MAIDSDEDSQPDPLQDVPDIERMTGNHDIIPEPLFFWRRKKNSGHRLPPRGAVHRSDVLAEIAVGD